MTINKEKLISLLVEKTEQDRTQVEEQLSELIGRIQKAASEGKSFEIKDFGTFTMQDDMLNFEPSDRLETEINNRYAGMKPIELIGAFKEPDGGEIPDVSAATEEDDDIWGIGKEPDPEPKESEEDPEFYEAPETEEIAEEKEQTPQDLYNRAEKILTEKQLAAEEEKLEPAAQTSSEDDKKDKATKEADPIGRFLVTAVVVLSLGVGGWFIYDLGFNGNNSTQANEVSASPQVAQQRESSPDRSEDLVNDNDSPQPGENVSGSEEKELIPEDKVTNNADNSGVQEENGDGSLYGLYGKVNTEIKGGYTIVVHSLRQQQKAAAMRDRLSEEGYRTVLSEASINGETYYRIGIGLFESIANAQEAVAGLPDNFKNNHFIRRI